MNLGEPTHRDTNDHGQCSAYDKLRNDFRAHFLAGHGCRHRCLEDHDCRGVVEESFALEDRDEPARHVHAARHGLHSYGVRRGHHGTQGNRGWNADSRDHEPGCTGHHCSGDHHQGHGHEKECPPAHAENRPGTLLRRSEQQGRKEDRQDQFRRDLKLGEAGNEGEPNSQEKHQDRIGKPEPVPQAHCNHRRKQQPDNERQLIHVPASPDVARHFPRPSRKARPRRKSSLPTYPGAQTVHAG